MESGFLEIQKFTQWWLRLGLILYAVLMGFGVVYQVILEKPLGNNPVSNEEMVILFFLAVSICLLFLCIKLRTSIDENNLKISFFPFFKKKVTWSAIESTRIINYGFIGGWGIRYSIKHKWVYSTGGEWGLEVRLKNGSKFTVGTQEKEKLKSFMENNVTGFKSIVDKKLIQ